MLGAGGTGIDIAGVSLGLREGVLFLIVLVAFYIGRVLWRMQDIGRRAGQKAQGKAAGEPEAAAPAPLPEANPAPASEALSWQDEIDARGPETLPNAVPAGDVAGLRQEIDLLRDEVDILRSELAALRNDMQQDLAQLRVAQNVSPLYGDAMQMALAGHTAEMIAERCGIARAEAELVVALTQSQAAAQMQRG